MLKRQDILDLATELDAVVYDIVQETQKTQPAALSEIAHRLVSLSAIKKKIKAVFSSAEKIFKMADKEMIEAFVLSESTGIRVAGKNLFPVTRITCKRLVSASPALIVMLKKEGLSDLVCEQANVQSIASHYKEAMPSDYLGDPNDLLSDGMKEVIELREHTTTGIRS